MDDPIIKESKSFLTNDIAPKLIPNITGNFQVFVNGIYRKHAEIFINLVNGNGQVVKKFGSNIIPIGAALNVDEFSSLLNIENAMPITAFFQVWFVGVDKNCSNGEFLIRLVDSDRKKLINFGVVQLKPGKQTTLRGLDISVNIIPKRLMQ